jgi:hypothetical protein
VDGVVGSLRELCCASFALLGRRLFSTEEQGISALAEHRLGSKVGAELEQQLRDLDWLVIPGSIGKSPK